MYYQRRIAELAPQHDPRHIEAYMRLQYSVLDHLSRDDFVREVHLCARCVGQGGYGAAEKLARSMGL